MDPPARFSSFFRCSYFLFCKPEEPTHHCLPCQWCRCGQTSCSWRCVVCCTLPAQAVPCPAPASRMRFFFCGHSEKNHPLGGGVGHTFNNDLHRTLPIQWCALRQRQRQFRLGNVLCRKISVLLRLVLVLCWMLVEAPNYPKGAPCKVFIAYPVLCLKKVGVAFPDGRTNA